MCRSRRSPAILSAVLAIAALTPTTAAASNATSCLADWSEAAPIVLHEGLTPIRALQHLARTHLAGDLVRITLCREEARFVYRLVMRDARGRITMLVVDARHPFAR